MPELPEVETVRQGLLPLVGATIAAVRRSDAPLRKPSPVPISALVGRTIQGIRRHAKVLFIDLDEGTLVAHLGMTGKFLFADGSERPHTHVEFDLDNGQTLRFIDPRRFGWVSYHLDHPGDADHYGPDALSLEFTLAHLTRTLKNSRAPTKAFLLDQTKVAGLGNIYACEALWRAGISPRRLACNVGAPRIPALHGAIREVLRAAIGAGGTSFNDYMDTMGKPGEFVASLGVFQREGEPCPKCGHEIRRIVQGGRSTFYCGTCQT